ncbi:MAG: undecaprenyl-diphosphate phosphatase [Tepidisphaeraceae bacterium]
MTNDNTGELPPRFVVSGDMEMWQALILGALQGITELFPVSSLAQTILWPALLGWNLGPNERERPDFLAFLVALHLATAIALFIYFWKDWRVVIAAFIGSAKRGRLIYDEPSKFAWLLVAGTIVVGLMGLVFEKKLRLLFEDPSKTWIVAVVLVVNGFGMLLADVVKRRLTRSTPEQRGKAEDLTLIEGASIGATQTLALVPGVSRAGVTIAAGLLAGLSYEQAGRFSFMLATPVIGLAAILKVPTLFKPEARAMLQMTAASALVAGICAYLSTRFLMRYFRSHRLGPFGWYCIVFGILSLWMLRR